MKVINDDIKNSIFKSSYLLYGEEGYLINLYRKRLVNAIVGDNTLNLTVIDEKPDINRIISIAETMPFMSPRRVIVFDRCGLFKIDKDKSEKLSALLENMPEYLSFIITEESVDKRKSIFKSIKKGGHVCEFSQQSEANVLKFIMDRCGKEGKEIDKTTAQEIYVRTGGDLGIISGELEKLFSYSLDRESISIEDVKTVCSIRVEERVFEMIDAIAYRDKKKTYDLYFDLLAVKEPPMKILILMERHFSGLLQVSESPEMPVAELAKTIGMKGVAPFVAGRYLKQVKAFTSRRLRELRQRFAETEEDIKSGRMSDKTGTELMIAEALL